MKLYIINYILHDLKKNKLKLKKTIRYNKLRRQISLKKKNNSNIKYLYFKKKKEYKR
jgi:hypothetical protein